MEIIYIALKGLKTSSLHDGNFNTNKKQFSKKNKKFLLQVGKMYATIEFLLQLKLRYFQTQIYLNKISLLELVLS